MQEICAKANLIAHERKLKFLAQTHAKIHQYTIKFHYQNEAAMSGLVLLAAFSQHTGDPYKQSWSLMELWWTGRGLCVTVQLHGAGWKLLLFLDNNFGKFSTLYDPWLGLFHSFTLLRHFKSHSFSCCLAATTHPLLSYLILPSQCQPL